MKRFMRSVGYALSGWQRFFGKEANGGIQSVVAVLVVLTGWELHISATEWIAILLCIALVISLEMVNSAIETMANHLHPGKHVAIKALKDLSAGAVLWAAVISAIIGLIIFVPKLWIVMG